jgi:serine/threonine protein kinase
MPLSPSDKQGPYESVGPLGKGGMGEVWKARDTRLNRIAAVKRLKGQYRARFAQEARAIGGLNNRDRNIGRAATLFTADDPTNRLRS